MTQDVIDNAKAIVGSDNRDFEAVLEKLEASVTLLKRNARLPRK